MTPYGVTELAHIALLSTGNPYGDWHRSLFVPSSIKASVTEYQDLRVLALTKEGFRYLRLSSAWRVTYTKPIQTAEASRRAETQRDKHKKDH